MTKNIETIRAIIENLEQAQKQRELGFKVPPILTPEEHLIIISYWKNLLKEYDYQGSRDKA